MDLTFATDIQRTLLEGRILAESLMLDTCRITRAGSGRGDWNDDTGTYDPPEPTTLYEGKAKVQNFQSYERDTDAGEQRITVQRYFVHVPVGSVRYQQGDDVLILTSAHNPSLPGTEYTVAGAHDKSLQTSHRLLVDEVLPRG